MSLFTIQRSPSDEIKSNVSSTNDYDESSVSKSQNEDYFTSSATAVLQNQRGRRRSSVILEGDTMQYRLKKALDLLRKEDKLSLIVNIEKVNSRIEGYRYFCVVLTHGSQNTEEFTILGVDICSNKASIGLVLPICQDMSVSLDGDSGFKVKNKGGEKLFKPTSVHALWSTVQLLNKACLIAHRNNYYIGGLSHTWIDYYNKKISSTRAQIAEWNRMIDANTLTNSSMAPKSAIGEFVIGTHSDENVHNKDEIRNYLKEIMREEDMDNVTVSYLRDQLQKKVSFNLKDYRSFIADEILIIYGQMDSASEILPHLFLGSTYNASDLDELLKNKITHILNVTRETENFFRDRFTYRNVEVFDVDQTNILNYFDICYQFINEAKNNNSVCLVHCQRGISRSATVVIAYMMKEFNLSRDKALEEVKRKRECILPNDSFMIQLKTYEGILQASGQRHNQQFQSKSRNKIMSFPNDLYQISEQDINMTSPTSSCPTPQRQSASQCDQSSWYVMDGSTTDITNSTSLPDDNTFALSGGLLPATDNNENSLLNNQNIMKSEVGTNFRAVKGDTNEKENDALVTSYQCKDLEEVTLTGNILNPDSNTVLDAPKTLRTNEFCKRSLRLKGDDSWITSNRSNFDEKASLQDQVSPVDALATNDNVKNEKTRSRKCRSAQWEETAIDDESLK